ncbi:phosphate/phosphite/phosphonate ABC transporter substrate-binding protein [Synechococcus sp. CBW1002]|uniref:phosphate/phosphite/phosphonate ABC transporter substrate-binding protein n=1 Tax=Synechococcus sp. CBW1002 TaxID=1353134 RepID=UPI001E3DD0E3|nr:phosphate/phosphite/phosphonate ABC transporter substrate-binding protein [Synechococcus sp. CBW1002]
MTAWLSLAACTTSSQQKDLILGIQGAGGLTETERQFKPLADYLSQSLSRNVKVEVMPSYQAGMNSIKIHKYAMAKLGPYAYATLPVNSGYKLFAGESSKGLPYYYSVFIARADSNIKELSDARGKRVALGDPLSASQSVLINRELASLGLSAGVDYTVVRLDNHKAILNALASNKADIGPVSSRFLPKILAASPTLFSDLVVIGNSRRIPNDAWVIDSTLPSDLKSKIEDAFFSLDDTKVTEEIENVDLFRNVSDDEYDFLRTTPRSAKK